MAVAEILPYVPGARAEWEWHFERHYSGWAFRIGLMVLILQVYNQDVVVEELKGLALAKGVPEKALPIAIVVDNQWSLETPGGSVISWTGGGNGLRVGIPSVDNGSVSFSGFGPVIRPSGFGSDAVSGSGGSERGGDFSGTNRL